jgi:mannitol/fructose-specific phosphotransferase system IIA component (Ntr-type)
MRLRDYFAPGAVGLDLKVTSREEALPAMVDLLGVDPESASTLLKTLIRREQLGSTGVGQGIAIPHCRATVVPKLRLAFGRVPAGIPYDAIDGGLVYNLFLIVAPPLEVSNEYLPVLGHLAQFAKGPDIPGRLARLTRPEDFFSLLDEKNA